MQTHTHTDTHKLFPSLPQALNTSVSCRVELLSSIPQSIIYTNVCLVVNQIMCPAGRVLHILWLQESQVIGSEMLQFNKERKTWEINSSAVKSAHINPAPCMTLVSVQLSFRSCLWMLEKNLTFKKSAFYRKALWMSFFQMHVNSN